MVRSVFGVAASLMLTVLAAAQDDQASATLPLDELLRLHTEAAQERDAEEPAPPIGFSVDAVDIEARIIGNAIEAKAGVRLRSFADGWVRVPLLARQSGLQITSLPNVQNGSFVSDEDAVSFLTNEAGVYEFEIAFVKEARRRGPGWTMDLEAADALIQRLRLAYDRGLFEVDDARARRDGERIVVFARDGRFALSWTTLTSHTTLTPSDTEQPPIDPVVREAAASVVVTLDGQRISRYRYNLSFQGPEEIVAAIPDGQELSKVYLNGVSQVVETDDAAATIAVVPPRPGEQSAVLELVVTDQTEPLALAGQLQFSLPTLSWGVNELQVKLHLPSVFNYSWAGGSLSPRELPSELPRELNDAPRYTLEVPTPGKVVAVHQQLVLGFADVQVDYAVDLADKYFR